MKKSIFVGFIHKSYKQQCKLLETEEFKVKSLIEQQVLIPNVKVTLCQNKENESEIVLNYQYSERASSLGQAYELDNEKVTVFLKENHTELLEKFEKEQIRVGDTIEISNQSILIAQIRNTSIMLVPLFKNENVQEVQNLSENVDTLIQDYVKQENKLQESTYKLVEFKLLQLLKPYLQNDQKQAMIYLQNALNILKYKEQEMSNTQLLHIKNFCSDYYGEKALDLPTYKKDSGFFDYDNTNKFDLQLKQ